MKKVQLVHGEPREPPPSKEKKRKEKKRREK